MIRAAEIPCCGAPASSPAGPQASLLHCRGGERPPSQPPGRRRSLKRYAERRLLDLAAGAETVKVTTCSCTIPTPVIFTAIRYEPGAVVFGTDTSRRVLLVLVTVGELNATNPPKSSITRTLATTFRSKPLMPTYAYAPDVAPPATSFNSRGPLTAKLIGAV